jgi:hypothetical protein
MRRFPEKSSATVAAACRFRNFVLVELGEGVRWMVAISSFGPKLSDERSELTSPGAHAGVPLSMGSQFVGGERARKCANDTRRNESSDL